MTIPGIFKISSFPLSLPAQVLKIAILSEKYAHDYMLYVDTILNLIRLAGDYMYMYVSKEVWYRIVQVVVNTQEVQGYAAKTCFEVTFLTQCIETISRRRYIVYCVCTYIHFNQQSHKHLWDIFDL